MWHVRSRHVQPNWWRACREQCPCRTIPTEELAGASRSMVRLVKLKRSHVIDHFADHERLVSTFIVSIARWWLTVAEVRHSRRSEARKSLCVLIQNLTRHFVGSHGVGGDLVCYEVDARGIPICYCHPCTRPWKSYATVSPITSCRMNLD